MPQFLIIHWGGKLVDYGKKRYEERLAIVASVPANNPNNNNKKQFQWLGAPYMESGTGNCMCEVLMEMLNEWQIDFGTILGTSWDTTASNTGEHQGSAFHDFKLRGRLEKSNLVWPVATI